ncbi:MAG: hypothetical protein WCL51_05435 [Bacteroidota bacterium]
MGNTKLINTIRWTAIIIGTLMTTFVLLFGIGYLIEGLMKPNNGDANGLKTGTIIGFVIWGIGLAALILAIWKPATGGLISFISIIVFNIMVALSTNPESRYSPVLLIFLLPSILYLLYWWLKKKSKIIS